jgi:alpha-mannosidase
MEKHLDLTRQRLQAFASDNHLGGTFYPRRSPVKLSVFSAPDRIPYTEAILETYRPTKVGEQFGPGWSTHWFKVEIEIPADWKGEEVHLLWDSSSEAAIYQDDIPAQGLTGSANSWTSDALRKEYRLIRSASGEEKLVVWVEIACNHLFGLEGGLNANPQLGLLRQAEIAVFDRPAWDLYWDFKIIADMAQYLPDNAPRAGQALYAANAMVNAIHLEDRTTWPAARAIASEFFSAHNGDGQHNISAIGHAHIDTAWLWPLAETRRKCIRTFSSALRYMEDYPEYKFTCSQAVQYEWIKEMQPELYAKIKTRVAEGRFVPAGGTWVEMDCNIPTGESFVRQFLFGERYFRQEFGITCDEFWEPDVFGYSAALPQIMRGFGIKNFLTQKLSWNQFNKLPDQTFYWEGLDGSRVLTHFPPTDTYNSVASVKEVIYHVNNFKDHDRARESYLVFGYGDGGGGPTLGMLEQLQRMKDVDGLPRIEIRPPHEFFTRCREDAKDLATWVGELYFELHRGTYTTQAHNKRYNRQSEFLLHNIEFLSAVNQVIQNQAYPAADLDQMWKTVLLNQFHDIIPGSSITMVYQESTVQYLDLIKKGTVLQNRAIESIVKPSVTEAENICTFNTLAFPRTEVSAMPAGTPTRQVSAGGQPLGVVSAPSMGYSVVPMKKDTGPSVSLTENKSSVILENDSIRAVIDRNGGLISLVDKAVQRECIANDKVANRFIIFDDVPAHNDAWDIDIFHFEKRYAVAGAKSMTVSEVGPLRASLKFEYDLTATSSLTQTISLTAVSPYLEFDTQVDWHENRKLLKVEFPFNLRSQNATYEIQFGHVQRPTHWNTSWDMARFEVCAHRWADLSELDFGVSLLNDCKYGYSTHGNVMQLSLLRSPKNPDPVADLGQHTFRYALLPHTGSFQSAGIIEQGYAFNQPLFVSATNAALAETSFFSMDNPHVILETVKKAEDSDAIIVRLYEAHGTRGVVRLNSCLSVKSITRCNLMEEEDVPVEWKNNGVDFEVTPFQIVTFKLICK